MEYGDATLYGLPGNQIDRLQSVMNAVARLVFSPRKYEHVTPLLRDELRRVADRGTRRRLRSTSSPALVVPPTGSTKIGNRSFPVAGARVWNALPSFVTDSSTISAFKRHLKTYLCEVPVLTATLLRSRRAVLTLFSVLEAVRCTTL